MLDDESQQSGRVILCIYVDDVCCIGDNKAVEETIMQSETIYKIKKVGKLSDFIVANIEIKNEDLFFTQADTLRHLERKFSNKIN